MEKAGHLDPQPWINLPETKAVMAALGSGGGVARFVGGCVRDALLGREVKDIDIATELPPEQVVARLEAAGVKAVPTGIEHGTITAVSGGRAFEITTLRRDVETFGRHARVAFSDDWDEDARRRDFTVNAMYCDADGTLYDPMGGRDDLERRRIRFVGDPLKRIAEDHLRILRFFRFHAHFGEGPPDAPALAACRAKAQLLTELSVERVSAELLRLLAAADPAATLALMAEARALAVVLPEADNAGRLERLCRIEQALELNDPLRRLAALCPLNEATAGFLAHRLRLSKSQRLRLQAIVGVPLNGAPEITSPALRRMLFERGPNNMNDIALLAWAEADASGGEDNWLKLLAHIKAWTAPELPIRGRDAVASGLAPGPQVGRALAAVTAWWADGDFQADRAACLEKLNALERASFRS